MIETRVFTAAQASTAWFRALVQSRLTHYLSDEILALTGKAIVIELPLVQHKRYGLEHVEAAPKVAAKFEKFSISEEEPAVIGLRAVRWGDAASTCGSLCSVSSVGCSWIATWSSEKSPAGAPSPSPPDGLPRC